MADIDLINEFKVTRIYLQDSFMVRTLIRVKNSITSNFIYLLIDLKIRLFIYLAR